MKTWITQWGLVVVLVVGCSTLPSTKTKQGKLVLLYQANRVGTLEPCGCKAKPYGGVEREFNAISKIQAEHETLSVDAGNLFSADTTKAMALVELVNHLGLEVFAPGPKDYSLGISVLRELEKAARFSFISSNVFNKEGPVFQPYSVLIKDGIRVGVLSLTPMIHLDGAEVLPAKEVLPRFLAKLKSATDLIILLSQFPSRENERLSAEFPEVHVIVGTDDELAQPEPFWLNQGRALLLDGYSNGYRLGRLNLDLILPFRGFYSEVLQERKLHELSMWNKVLDNNANDVLAKSFRDRILESRAHERIDGACWYSHEHIALDRTRYGKSNIISSLLDKNRRAIQKSALTSE